MILVIDEIESVLSKLPSCSDRMEVYRRFVKLIENSQKVIIMDGLMEPRTIEYLCIIRRIRKPSDCTVIVNQFKPRSDYTMIVHPYRKEDAQHIADLFLMKCQQGGKANNVYGMITSNRLGEFVRQFLEKNGINVMYYHGDNKKMEALGADQMM